MYTACFFNKWNKNLHFENSYDKINLSGNTAIIQIFFSAGLWLVFVLYSCFPVQRRNNYTYNKKEKCTLHRKCDVTFALKRCVPVTIRTFPCQLKFHLLSIKINEKLKKKKVLWLTKRHTSKADLITRCVCSSG